jgi:hypothetical protein
VDWGKNAAGGSLEDVWPISSAIGAFVSAKTDFNSNYPFSYNSIFSEIPTSKVRFGF